MKEAKVGDTVRYKDYKYIWRITHTANEKVAFAISLEEDAGVHCPKELKRISGDINDFEVVSYSRYAFEKDEKITLCGLYFNSESQKLKYKKFTATVIETAEDTGRVTFEFDEQHFDRRYIRLDEMLAFDDEYQYYVIGFPEDLEIMKRAYIGKLDEDIYNCQEEINEKISELLYISANDMEEVS